MDLSSAFSFKVLKAMARYKVTHSIESQTLAIDNVDGGSIQTTGTSWYTCEIWKMWFDCNSTMCPVVISTSPSHVGY